MALRFYARPFNSGVMLLSLLKLMRNYKSILALILIISAIGFGYAGASKESAEWSLYLKTGGIPFPNTKQFEVKLDYSGKLLVAEQDENNKTTRIERNIPAKDAQEIYEQARFCS